ncbi:MAG: hypothetical protein HY069_05045 [Chlamydiia bacterium]|nr:hypothetical protein [Chlamydiia bacterium]
MRYTLRALCFALPLLFFPLAYRELSKGFRLDKLVTPWAHGFLDPLTKASEQLVAQDFFYLSQGTQSYVFVSQDGKYVLKLFRFEGSANPLYCFIREKIRQKPLRMNAKEKEKRLYTACEIAGQYARQESALIALHTAKTDHIWPRVCLHLPLGRTLWLDLNHASFAIQEKAERIFDSLKTTADPDVMKRKLSSLHDLFKSRASKHLVNLDPNLHRNFGFVGERAIEMDMGAYIFSENRQADYDRSSQVATWLAKHAPVWRGYWDSLLSENEIQ